MPKIHSFKKKKNLFILSGERQRDHMQACMYTGVAEGENVPSRLWGVQRPTRGSISTHEIMTKSQTPNRLHHPGTPRMHSLLQFHILLIFSIFCISQKHPAMMFGNMSLTPGVFLVKCSVSKKKLERLSLPVEKILMANSWFIYLI